MSVPTDWNLLGKPLRTLQIIVFALTAGLVVFFIVAQVVPQRGGPDPDAGPVMTYLACAVAFLEVILRQIIPPRLVISGRRRLARGQEPVRVGRPSPVIDVEKTGDAGRLFGLLMTSTITSCALLEGGAFFAFIAYIMENTLLSLSVGLLLTLGVAMHFPTQARTRHWLRHHLELLELERKGMKP